MASESLTSGCVLTNALMTDANSIYRVMPGALSVVGAAVGGGT